MPDEPANDKPTNQDTPVAAPVPEVEVEPSTNTEAAQPVEQTGVEPAEQPAAAPVTSVPKKSGKKKWIIGGVIAGTLVLLGGGGVLAYVAWHESPDKVLADGFANVLHKQPTGGGLTLAVEGGDIEADLKLDATGNDKLSKAALSLKIDSDKHEIDLTGQAEMVSNVESGTFYLKLRDVRQTVEQVIDAAIEQSAESYESLGLEMTDRQVADQKKRTMTQLEPIITKIDNKWIKFNADGTSSTSKEQKCLNDTMKKLRDDAEMRRELVNVYADNKFVEIKENLGVKDGSHGFVLDINQEKARAFGKAGESTAFARALKACTGETSSRSDTTTPSTNSGNDDLKNTRVEVWVSQWSHQITAMKMNTTYTGTGDDVSINADVKLDYSGAAENIEEPTDAVDAETLQQDLQQLMGVGVTTPTPTTPAYPTGLQPTI